MRRRAPGRKRRRNGSASRVARSTQAESAMTSAYRVPSAPMSDRTARHPRPPRRSSIAAHERHHAHAGPAWKLALPDLGVVYGDIGTSPLYTLKECFQGDHAVPASVPNVFGILSLVFWALTFTVTIKYLLFILRADNEGEGGILALLALVPQP